MWLSWPMGKKKAEQRQIEAIAARLRAGQEALGLSQVEVCRQAQIAPNTYNQWIKAKGRPQLDAALQLCDAFGYTLDWIYQGDPSGLPARLAAALAGVSLPTQAPRRA
jgi:transcriptional regulator with XRE-family HTH domain